MNVSVIGGSGLVAGELLRLLLLHPAVDTVGANSRSHSGERLSDTHPGLAGWTDDTFSTASTASIAADSDVVFLALEHGASSRVMEQVMNACDGIVVDLAADFRISDPELRAACYGHHEAPHLQPRFAYALADVEGESLHGSRALAVPGCFATAAALALRPLAAMPLDAPPVLFGVTGSSGAGGRPRLTTHHPLRAANFFAYGVLGHRHQAEIDERWKAWGHPSGPSPRLSVHSGPFVRGIHITLHARTADAERAVESYEEVYAERPFVRLLGGPPDLTHAVGTNHALLHAAASADGTELQVMIAIDNLIKGAAGQAIQSMNLALGIDETAGLLLSPAFPC